MLEKLHLLMVAPVVLAVGLYLFLAFLYLSAWDVDL